MKKRKILSILLVCLLVFALVPPAQAQAQTTTPTPTLTDIGGHWAAGYIQRAVNLGFVTGFPDGTFRPDDPVTRAQFTAMVNRALGNTGTTSLTFTDVPHYEWFHADVARAFAAAYVGGYEDNTFRPNNPISRQEAAVMISRIIPAHNVVGNLNAFPDRHDIADWAFSALQKVNGKGYMGGFDDGRLHPLANLTRAQTAKIIGDILDGENIVRTDPIIRNAQTISNSIFPNGLTIHADVGEGSVTIENSVILGTLRIQGGGINNGVVLSNSRAAQAVVERAASPVRFVVRGESVVVGLTAAREATIQTQHLAGGLHGSGITNLNVLSNADIRLEGNFPRVSVNGTGADVRLASGSIANLTVSNNGTSSNITVDSGTTVSTAVVNARSYFHGQGTITTMTANASGITYERRPVNVNTAAGVTGPTLSTPAPRITFNPAHGATSVPRGSNITITFDSAMTLQNGNAITSANIENFVTLRRGSATGAHVPFTATINSARTVITIIPDDNFNVNTTYHLSIPANRVRDANGESNTAQNISFSTGAASAFVTFTPAQGAVVPVTTREMTITFTEAIQTSGGATITLEWLRNNNVFVLRSGTTTATGGSAVAFTVQNWNANNRTATIRTNNTLGYDDFYLGVAANRLRTTNGHTPIPATGITFSTGDSHTIEFRANGGSGTMQTRNVPRGNNFTIPANTFTRSGWAFLNWNTRADGAGTSFAAGGTINNVRDDFVLHAQWGRSITFNANGGTGSFATAVVANGANYAIPAAAGNAFSRSGHTFAGWNTQANGQGTAFAPTATINNVQANMTLFAIWTPVAAVLTITQQPTAQTVSAGQNATFTVAATAPAGQPAPSFQWQVNTGGGWTNVSPGGTSATLTVSNTTQAQNGNYYRVIVRSGTAEVTSNTVMLTVTAALAAPVITVAPTDQTVEAGQSVTFSATATGNPTPAFRWYLDDGTGFSVIPGAVGPTLNLPNVTAEMSGFRYRVTVENSEGMVFAVATLTVNPIGASPADE